MIRSMTGFGRAENTRGGWRCSAELRSVNGRYLDVRMRLPVGLTHMEDALRKLIQARCERGRIDGTITLAPEGEGSSALALNLPLLQSYRAIVQELRSVLDEPVHASLGDLLGIRELIRVKGWEDEPERVEALVHGTVEEALTELLAMRHTEGVALREALLEHATIVRRLCEEMKPLTDQLPALYAQRLRDNLARLSDGVMPGDERILQEVTIFADRCDVTEEFARLGIHLDHLQQMLRDGGAVGRKLEFLLQELQREANTLGVKSSDAQVSARVIDMKSEIEKLREQVHNIE